MDEKEEETKMKNFPFVLFGLSFFVFCSTAGLCLSLFCFPYGLFRPVIACDTNILELGTINNDVDIDCQFEIKNKGHRLLYLHKVEPACGSGNEIKVTAFPLEPLKPGGQKCLMVRFHPYSLRGKVLKKIVIVSNDPRFPHFILSISATVNNIPPPPQSPAPVLAPKIE